MMKIPIFTADLINHNDAAAWIQKAVNEFIKDKPDAQIQWLQSTGSGYLFSTTQLTAVITYSA